MRWLWADWGGRDRAQQTQGVQQGAPSGRLKTGKLGRSRGRTQTRPRVALAAQAAASATGPLGRASGASLGSAYADTSAATFFAPAVAPASTVAAMYWEAGRNTSENWELHANAQRDWPSVGYGVAGDGAHNDLRDDARSAMTRQRSAMAATQATAPATVERRRGQPTSEVGDATKASRRARHGLTTTLLRATAQAAEALGRAPEEVWAEALNVWLANQEALAEAVAMADDGQPTRGGAGHARPIEVRRQETWSEIDATLSALRAS